MAETFERKIAEIVERFVSWIRIMAFEGVRIKSPPLPSSPLQTSHAQPCFRKRQCELEITIPRLIVILARKRITIRNRARKIWDLERRGVAFPSLDRTRVIRAKVMLLLFGARYLDVRQGTTHDGLKKGQGPARYFQRGRRATRRRNVMLGALGAAIAPTLPLWNVGRNGVNNFYTLVLI